MPRYRKPRDRYLDLLARERLFRGVPRHLIVVLGRHVELLEMAPGDVLRCDPAREAMIVTEGQAFLSDADGRAVGTIGPHAAIGTTHRREAGGPHRLVAATPLRVVVIARPELGTVARIAPAVAAALASPVPRAPRHAVPRTTVGTAR